MASVRVGLLGVGVVGSGFLTLLRARARAVEEIVGAPVSVTRAAVRDPAKPRDADLSGIEVGRDPMAVADSPEIDLLVELMGGADTTLGPVLRALERGVPVVTANKHLLAVHGARLEAAAAKSGASLRSEGSVGGVIPVLQALDHGFRTERFTLLVGILNGTTNFILSTMEREGRDFAEALDAARALGFAEADPSLDLSGADTAQKLTLLVRRAFAIPLDPATVPTDGILGMELEDLRQAERFGYVVKLLGIAQALPEGLDLRVHPAFIPKRYLLASVRDEFNAVYLRGDSTGSMMLYGKGAGAMPTAQAVLGDVLASAREIRGRGAADAPRSGPRGLPAGVTPRLDGDARRVPIDEVRTKYYIRLLVEDQPGVLAQVSQRLGACRVSVAQMFQAPAVKGEATITMLTHEARDRNVRDAVAAIAELRTVRRPPRAIRIFDI